MEREIKFRAWDKIGRNMVDWLTMRQTAFNRGEYQMLYKIIVQHSDNFCIMQFTERKDKNGKDCYDGDIVKSAGSREYYKIVWGGYGWRIVPINTNRAIQSFKNISRQEIIGNIYEHPHLLESPSKQ